MSDLKEKFDTQFNILTTGLNSLAASATAALAAAEIDNTTNLYDDVLIVCQFVLTTGTPGGSNSVYVHGLGSNDGTIYSGDTSYSGTAAAYTLGSAGSPNMGAPATIYMPSQSITRQKAFWLSSLFGGPIPPFWSLVVVNDTNIALASSGSTVTGRGLWYQSV
jgi:hypothetical protein